MSEQTGLRTTPDYLRDQASSGTFASGPYFGGTNGEWLEAAQHRWRQVVVPWAAYSLAVFLFSAGLFLTYWGVASSSVENNPSSWSLTDYRILLLVGLVLYAFVVYPFSVGGVGVALRILRNQPWTFASFFGFLPRYGTYVALGAFYYILAALLLLPFESYWRLGAAGLLPDFPNMSYYALIGSVGLLLVLFVAWLAGVAWLHLRFAFAATFVEDRKVGPLQALKESWKLTAGRTAGVFWLCYDTGLMLFLGFLPTLAGFAFVASLATLAHVAAYLHCHGETRRQAA